MRWVHGKDKIRMRKIPGVYNCGWKYESLTYQQKIYEQALNCIDSLIYVQIVAIKAFLLIQKR